MRGPDNIRGCGADEQSDRSSAGDDRDPVLGQVDTAVVYDHHDSVTLGGGAGRLPVVAVQVLGPEFVLDAVLDIPIVLPPLVVGLSRRSCFNTCRWFLCEAVVYEVPAVILRSSWWRRHSPCARCGPRLTRLTVGANKSHF